MNLPCVRPQQAEVSKGFRRRSEPCYANKKIPISFRTRVSSRRKRYNNPRRPGTNRSANSPPNGVTYNDTDGTFFFGMCIFATLLFTRDWIGDIVPLFVIPLALVAFTPLGDKLLSRFNARSQHPSSTPGPPPDASSQLESNQIYQPHRKWYGSIEPLDTSVNDNALRPHESLRAHSSSGAQANPPPRRDMLEDRYGWEVQNPHRGDSEYSGGVTCNPIRDMQQQVLTQENSIRHQHKPGAAPDPSPAGSASKVSSRSEGSLTPSRSPGTSTDCENANTRLRQETGTAKTYNTITTSTAAGAISSPFLFCIPSRDIAAPAYRRQESHSQGSTQPSVSDFTEPAAPGRNISEGSSQVIDDIRKSWDAGVGRVVDVAGETVAGFNAAVRDAQTSPVGSIGHQVLDDFSPQGIRSELKEQNSRVLKGIEERFTDGKRVWEAGAAQAGYASVAAVTAAMASASELTQRNYESAVESIRETVEARSDDLGAVSRSSKSSRANESFRGGSVSDSDDCEAHDVIEGSCRDTIAAARQRARNAQTELVNGTVYAQEVEPVEVLLPGDYEWLQRQRRQTQRRFRRSSTYRPRAGRSWSKQTYSDVHPEYGVRETVDDSVGQGYERGKQAGEPERDLSHMGTRSSRRSTRSYSRRPNVRDLASRGGTADFEWEQMVPFRGLRRVFSWMVGRNARARMQDTVKASRRPLLRMLLRAMPFLKGWGGFI